ncbi:hypothetical protein [Paenibacillus daejeonensis]|uniref:hypothetical protein n=1 Tax=Paenibacillus daejeonensis TaxID=135193 RepID=UPI000371DC57|nr:hypothetical protein [Paenibacillus daejeonensis]
MWKIRVILYSALLVLVTIIGSGCTESKNGEMNGVGTLAVKNMTDVIGTDFSDVVAIHVQFGDGHEMEVTDSKIIDGITEKIAQIDVQETISKGVGYLYYLDIQEGSNTYRLDSNLTFNQIHYEATDDKDQQLNDYIISLGKEQFPDLFAGKQ